MTELILILILALVATSIAWFLTWRARMEALEARGYALEGWAMLISRLPQVQRARELTSLSELSKCPEDSISGPDGAQASAQQLRNQRLLQRVTQLAESRIEDERDKPSQTFAGEASPASNSSQKGEGASPFPWGDTWSRPQ